MQDRHKFKVWCKNKNSWEDDFCFLTPEGKLMRKLKMADGFKEADSNHIIVFCTGMKDHTGKLIYEGDIVKVTYDGGQIPLFDRTYQNEPEPEIFYIEYSKDWQTYFCRNIDKNHYCNPPFDYLTKSFESQLYPNDADVNNRVTLGKAILVNNYNKFCQIIGNIYDNPEILKGEENAM